MYPPGYAFWVADKVQQEAISHNAARCNKKDGGCGLGKLNACDSDECCHQGDCSFNEGQAWYQGALLYATIGAAAVGLAYVTVTWGPALWGMITPGGAGEGSTVMTSGFAPGELETAASIEGSLAAGQTAVKTGGLLTKIWSVTKTGNQILGTLLTIDTAATVFLKDDNGNPIGMVESDDPGNYYAPATEIQRDDILGVDSNNGRVKIRTSQGQEGWVSCKDPGVTLYDQNGAVISC